MEILHVSIAGAPPSTTSVLAPAAGVSSAAYQRPLDASSVHTANRPSLLPMRPPRALRQVNTSQHCGQIARPVDDAGRRSQTRARCSSHLSETPRDATRASIINHIVNSYSTHRTATSPRASPMPMWRLPPAPHVHAGRSCSCAFLRSMQLDSCSPGRRVLIRNRCVAIGVGADMSRARARAQPSRSASYTLSLRLAVTPPCDATSHRAGLQPCRYSSSRPASYQPIRLDTHPDHVSGRLTLAALADTYQQSHCNILHPPQTSLREPHAATRG